MLSGRLARPMLVFALPVIASGILQQSFNAVDIAVAGRFAGSEALAAVGSNGPVIGLLINLFLGISVGVNVIIANYIGQQNGDGVRRAVSASAFLALLCGIGVSVLTLIIARPILECLGTPEECLEAAVAYLRIFALGMPFLIIYNFAAAILRSVGDTRRPFYSLVAAGCVNVCLNMIFVISFGMGVEGVAWATVISNVINAALVVWWLCMEPGDIKLRLCSVAPNGPQLRKIIAIGLPAGVQGTVFSISNVFILSAINSFGKDAAAGSAAAINFEMYCYFVLNSFGQTCVAFMSQNYGAGNLERCRKIFRICLIYSVVSTAALNVLMTWQRGAFAAVFNSESAVVAYASTRMATVLLFQFIACYYEMAASAMRALGHSMAPTVIIICGTCVMRLLWIAFFPSSGTFAELLLIYPLSWLLTDALMWLQFRRIRRSVGWV